MSKALPDLPQLPQPGDWVAFQTHEGANCELALVWRTWRARRTLDLTVFGDGGPRPCGGVYHRDDGDRPGNDVWWIRPDEAPAAEPGEPLTVPAS